MGRFSDNLPTFVAFVVFAKLYTAVVVNSLDGAVGGIMMGLLHSLDCALVMWNGPFADRWQNYVSALCAGLNTTAIILHGKQKRKSAIITLSEL